MCQGILSVARRAVIDCCFRPPRISRPINVSYKVRIYVNLPLRAIQANTCSIYPRILVK